jgi:toxin-antitoxin system PIN domain toxin
MHLLDINVWLGLAFKRHKHHISAIAWFNSIGQTRCCFCRLTQMGFLRLASNPQAMGISAVTLQQAWQAYDALFADPRVGYVEEPAGIDPVWRSLTQHQSFSPKVWNDAYLAAFAQTVDFEVITFDQGFAQHQGVRCTILL